jgi:putative phosphoesterase
MLGRCGAPACYYTPNGDPRHVIGRENRMKIGLISDTHIPEAMPELPAQIRDIFAGVDRILHAGDMHCLAVLDWLEEIAPVWAARGNGDNGSGGRPVVPDDPRLQEAQVITCAGWTVGVVHDVLDPEEMPQWPIARTMQHYFGQQTDMIVCGHTHVERIRRYGEVWVINPGSPTFPHNLAAQPGTVGLLQLELGGPAHVAIYDLNTLEPLPNLSVTL